MMEKIAGFILLNKTAAASSRLIDRLVVSLAAVFIIALVTSALAVMLIAGMLYALYHTLVLHGVTAGGALAIICILITAIIIAIISAAALYISRTRKPPGRVAALESVLAHRCEAVIDAFVDGMLQEQHPKKHPPK